MFRFRFPRCLRLRGVTVLCRRVLRLLLWQALGRLLCCHGRRRLPLFRFLSRRDGLALCHLAVIYRQQHFEERIDDQCSSEQLEGEGVFRSEMAVEEHEHSRSNSREWHQVVGEGEFRSCADHAPEGVELYEAHGEEEYRHAGAEAGEEEGREEDQYAAEADGAQCHYGIEDTRILLTFPPMVEEYDRTGQHKEGAAEDDEPVGHLVGIHDKEDAHGQIDECPDHDTLQDFLHRIYALQVAGATFHSKGKDSDISRSYVLFPPFFLHFFIGYACFPSPTRRMGWGERGRIYIGV